MSRINEHKSVVCFSLVGMESWRSNSRLSSVYNLIKEYRPNIVQIWLNWAFSSRITSWRAESTFLLRSIILSRVVYGELISISLLIGNSTFGFMLLSESGVESHSCNVVARVRLYPFQARCNLRSSFTLPVMDVWMVWISFSDIIQWKQMELNCVWFPRFLFSFTSSNFSRLLFRYDGYS